AVVGLEVKVRPVAQVEPLGPQHAAAGIAADALLDLDHLGAEVAEHHRGHGALLPDRPVDHADAVERHGHASSCGTGAPRLASATGPGAGPFGSVPRAW